MHDWLENNPQFVKVMLERISRLRASKIYNKVSLKVNRIGCLRYKEDILDTKVLLHKFPNCLHCC